MYKKAWCTCKVVVLLIKPMVFFRFSLPSASLDLKVPISSSHTLSSSRVFLKTEVFFLRFSIPSMRKRRFRAPKMQVFYKCPRVQILENAGFSVTSRRTKTMMSCIRTTSIARAPYQMLSYFHRFSVFMWTNKYAICGRVFLKTERKKYLDNDHDNGNKNLTNKFAF